MKSDPRCLSCGGGLEADDADGLCAGCLQRGLTDAGLLLEPGAGGGELGDYEILGEIARGGMGVVFRARSRRLKRIVALKQVHSVVGMGVAVRQRFLFEAEIAAGLDHPNIVPVYEFGESDGRPWFSMKLVEGGSLEARLADFVVADREGNTERCRRAAELLSTVARAVQHAHDHGVLHRDLKPSNILLDGHGTPHVTDFGLAKRVDGASSITLPDVVLGTPAYMAPEVARAGAVAAGVRSDVYSLGAVLHHLLAGRPPFAAQSTLELLRQVGDAQGPSASQLGRGVDRDLAVICSKCLESSDQRRYPTASELADDLDRYLRGEPIHARPVSATERTLHWCRARPVTTLLMVFLALALLVGAGGILWQWRRAEVSRHQAELNASLAQEAERQSAENAYHARIAEAMAAREQGNLGRTARILEDLSGRQSRFEWRLLRWLNRGDARREVHLDRGPAQCLAWVPGRKRVALLGGDRVLRWLDPGTGGMEDGVVVADRWEEHARIAIDKGFHELGFSPDGRHFHCADGDVLVVCETDTGRVLHSAVGRHMGAVWLDDHRVLVGGNAVWGAGRGDPTEVVDIQGGGRRRLERGIHGPFALTRDRQRVAWMRLTDQSEAVELVSTGVLIEGGSPVALRRLEGIAGFSPGLMAFSSDDTVLVAAGSHRAGVLDEVVVREVAGGELLLRHSTRVQIRGLAVAPDRSEVALATDDAVLRTIVYGDVTESAITYDDGGAPELSQPSGKGGPVDAPLRLLTRSAGGDRYRFFLGHHERIHAVAVSPGGDGWMTVGADDRFLRWGARPSVSGDRVENLHTLRMWEHPTASLDARYVLYRDTTDRTWAWDRTAGRTVPFPPGTHPLAALPDGIVVTRDFGSGDVQCWRVPATDGAEPSLLWRAPGSEAHPGFGQVVRGLAGRDGMRVVGLLPGRLTVVDLASRTCAGTDDQRMVYGANGVNCMDLSPDGSLLAVTGFIGRRVRVYSALDPNQPPVGLGDPADYDTAVAFHPDGQRLFVGNEDGSVRVFDVRTRQERKSEGWRAQTGAVTALAVSQDGGVVATSGDRTIRFWDAAGPAEGGIRRERLQVNVPVARNWMRFGDGDAVFLHCAPGQPLEAWLAPKAK